MNKLPLHKISEQFDGEIAMLSHISGMKQMPSIDYAHRDDYYMFLFMEKGYARLVIDFVEYELSGNAIFCILPGQIHFPVGKICPYGWVLGVDSALVKDEYKEVFEQVKGNNKVEQLSEEVKTGLLTCLRSIQGRLIPDRNAIEQLILQDLLSYYVGMVAEIFRRELPVSTNKRLAMITNEFKSLLSVNYVSLKRPAQYASLMNISPVYLNEAVKKTTGISVTDCIQQEVIIQAKRLLYYTDMSIKEVALALGYEDWAYFTRLFTKISAITPSQFKKQFNK